MSITEYPCPKCGEQGTPDTELKRKEDDYYICLSDECTVVEYTHSGQIFHEVGAPEMKQDALTECGIQ